jgi:hypothetical protein
MQNCSSINFHIPKPPTSQVLFYLSFISIKKPAFSGKDKSIFPLGSSQKIIYTLPESIATSHLGSVHERIFLLVSSPIVKMVKPFSLVNAAIPLCSDSLRKMLPSYAEGN